ncbi:MAG: HAMP domain-containing protein [Chloroflexia bacterium]|nr:HAMP domain-containing protein [Chloroflexia bacterium]MBA3643012.1 HAMP domain-containing protein [Chloroflexia bacterium]
MIHHWSLRTRFVLFATACLIPLLAVVVFFLDRGIERNAEQLINTESTLAQLINQTLQYNIQENGEALNTLARQPEVVALDGVRSQAVLGQYRAARPLLSGVFLTDQAGSVIAESGPPIAPLRTQLSSQIETTMATGDNLISNPLPLGDLRVIVLTYPITPLSDAEAAAANATTNAQAPIVQGPEAGDGTSGGTPAKPGEPVGAIGAIIQTDNLARYVVPLAPAQTEIAVTGPNDVILATAGIASNPAFFLDTLAPTIKLALDGDADYVTFTDADGEERLAVYTPFTFDGAEWGIFVTNPTPRAFARNLLWQSLIVLVLAGIVILALAIFFGEMTARPLRQLTAQAAAFRRGDFHQFFEPSGSGEIRALGSTFSEMAEQLSEQMQGLEETREERERQAGQLRDLLRRTVRLQEDERRRIAGEIHDAVSPLITGALYQARALQIRNGSTPPDEREQSLASVNQLLERASQELHGVIFDLRPPDLDDIGVVAAIEAYVQTIQRTGLACRLEAIGDSPSLTPEVRLGVYRIVQEALHNVVRHASADEAVVRLETTEHGLRVTIRDNGAGFDPESAVRPTSLGLLSMRERAAAIGANFTIVTRPGGGTAIVIERTDTGDTLTTDILAVIAANGLNDRPTDIDPSTIPANSQTPTTTSDGMAVSTPPSREA